MKKFIEKVTFNDSAASESPQGGAPGAEKKMPYEAPQVKVVEFQMERGFNGSSSLLGAKTEEMNSCSGWDMGHGQSVSTEEMSMSTGTGWGTFN